MARRRDFARGAVAIRSSRLTTWFQFPPSEAILTGGGVVIGSLNAAALALRPFTIVRTRGMLALRSDQAAAIERQAAAFGIAVVSDQAVAVGVTAVPPPITELASNLWLLHQLIYADESNLTDRTRSGQFMSIDSKAMRKVEVGQDVVVVGEVAGIGGGAILTSGFRMLVKNN